jgi:hypothetical protein
MIWVENKEEWTKMNSEKPLQEMLKEQFSPRAEILLGKRYCKSDGAYMAYPDLTFCLLIEGKVKSTVKTTQRYERACEVYASEYAKKLKECCISEYAITNGERIRHTNFARVKVCGISPDEVATFKKTLDKLLSE